MKTDLRYFDPLLSSGFSIEWIDHGERSIFFVKKHHGSDIYHGIKLWERDADGKAMTAIASISAVGHRPTAKGLFCDQVITEESDSQVRQDYCIINDDCDRKAWCSRMARLAPDVCNQLERRVGSELLRETLSSRRAINDYLSCVAQHNSIHDAIREFSTGKLADGWNTAGQAVLSGGWARWINLYQLALYIIYREQPRVEPAETFGRVAEWNRDQKLLWRVVILVNRFIDEFAIVRGELEKPPYTFLDY